MLYQKNFVRTAQLSREKETIIKLAENLEFTCPKFYDGNDEWHKIKNVKGDFKITKIIRKWDSGNEYVVDFNESQNKFYHAPGFSQSYTFYITTKILMKEIIAVAYQLQIPSARLQCLKPYQYFKDEFVLPGYDDLKFIYYVKKINESTENDIEIHIENPYSDVEIQDKQGDFKSEQSSSKNIDLFLSFSFDPSLLIKKFEPAAVENDEENISNEVLANQASIPDLPLPEHTEPIQTSAADESRPESVIEIEVSKTEETKLLPKICSNSLFSDVIFIASDGIKISSHRCVLAEFSTIFMQIFKESTELPVQINVDDFDADTIQSALCFMYDQQDAIKGKEVEVFKFAKKFGIQNLIEACSSFFEESVDQFNVCEYVQIAYDNDFEELKQKCLKVLVEKKKEIDPVQKTNLPKNILLDAYCF